MNGWSQNGSPSFIRRGLRRIQRHLPESDRGLLILAYHLVGAGTGSPVDISREAFRAQMSELCSRVQPVSLRRGVEPLLEGNEPEGLRVVVTFDDAYENFLQVALPVLADLHIPVTLYVPVGFVEGSSGPPIAGTEHLRPCSWSQLRDLVATGLVEVGSHTCSHPNLNELADEDVEHEARESRRILEDELGVAVDSFCYPKGLCSRRVESIVGSHYRTAVSGGGRRNRPGTSSLLRLNRIPVLRCTGSVAPLITHPVWLEEWAADKLRQWVRG